MEKRILKQDFAPINEEIAKSDFKKAEKSIDDFKKDILKIKLNYFPIKLFVLIV